MNRKTNTSDYKQNNYSTNTEFYNHVIDSLHDYSILTLDNELKISSWSSGSKKIFGYDGEEVIGQPFEMIFTEEDIKMGIPEREIKRTVKEGRATANRWHIAKDRSLFYTYGVVFPLIGSNGDKDGYVKIFRDITERKKSEDAIKNYIKELEELNRHKERVLAILSHDLRSPLANIIQLTDYLNDYYDTMEPVEIQEILDKLSKSSTQELKMLDYLVEWARIKQAAEVFSPKNIKLRRIISRVFESLKESASVKTIHVQQDIEEDTSVFADRNMLFSILKNIVSNAIKHSEKGGSITISAKKENHKILVKVVDTGCGMTKEKIKSLFKPHIKTLTAERQNNEGAGIGLLLVKGFLEKNGGEIWVESVKGAGSSFYFTLPIARHSNNGINLNLSGKEERVISSI